MSNNFKFITIASNIFRIFLIKLFNWPSILNRCVSSYDVPEWTRSCKLRLGWIFLFFWRVVISLGFLFFSLFLFLSHLLSPFILSFFLLSCHFIPGFLNSRCFWNLRIRSSPWLDYFFFRRVTCLDCISFSIFGLESFWKFSRIDYF